MRPARFVRPALLARRAVRAARLRRGSTRVGRSRRRTGRGTRHGGACGAAGPAVGAGGRGGGAGRRGSGGTRAGRGAAALGQRGPRGGGATARGSGGTGGAVPRGGSAAAGAAARWRRRYGRRGRHRWRGCEPHLQARHRREHRAGRGVLSGGPLVVQLEPVAHRRQHRHRVRADGVGQLDGEQHASRRARSTCSASTSPTSRSSRT